MANYHFIYKTTCKITNEYYIGRHSTNNINDDYLGSGKKLWAWIFKYGKQNFKREILEYCTDEISLAKREKEIVNESLIHDKSCLNMITGGDYEYTPKRNNGLNTWNKVDLNWKKLKF
jgi:hypothetical protein